MYRDSTPTIRPVKATLIFRISEKQYRPLVDKYFISVKKLLQKGFVLFLFYIPLQ